MLATRDDTAIPHGCIEYLAETVERENAQQIRALLDELLKPPMVEAVHAPIVSEVPVDVKVWRETQTNADAVKGILVTVLGIKVAAAGNVMSSPPNQIFDAAMLPKESQAALNIGLERSNDCLEGFIHGWCEQRLTSGWQTNL